MRLAAPHHCGRLPIPPSAVPGENDAGSSMEAPRFVKSGMPLRSHVDPVAEVPRRIRGADVLPEVSGLSLASRMDMQMKMLCSKKSALQERGGGGGGQGMD